MVLPALAREPWPMRRLAPLILLALSACHKADNQPGPGGITQGEARGLDTAADRIESEAPPAAGAAPAPQGAPSPGR